MPIVKRRLQNHTKIYFEYFGYDESSFIECEVCGSPAVDIHHVQARSMGGNPNGDRDAIENLMALCRRCHIAYGDKKEWKDWLKKVHKIKMESR